MDIVNVMALADTGLQPKSGVSGKVFSFHTRLWNQSAGDWEDQEGLLPRCVVEIFLVELFKLLDPMLQAPVE